MWHCRHWNKKTGDLLHFGKCLPSPTNFCRNVKHETPQPMHAVQPNGSCGWISAVCLCVNLNTEMETGSKHQMTSHQTLHCHENWSKLWFWVNVRKFFRVKNMPLKQINKQNWASKPIPLSGLSRRCQCFLDSGRHSDWWSLACSAWKLLLQCFVKQWGKIDRHCHQCNWRLVIWRLMQRPIACWQCGRCLCFVKCQSLMAAVC